MKNVVRICLLAAAVAGSLATPAYADEVTEWNQIMLDSLIAGNITGVVATRHAAIIQSAVYDAINGIEKRYTPLRVDPAAAPGASRRAAVVQAAYASLVKLFPAQKNALDVKLADSLSTIASDVANESSQSIANGVAWGQTVADAIFAWRSTDGFSTTLPPNTGGTAAGQWRPTPTAPFAALQFANMTPWLLQSPTQFPLPGPPALDSDKYARDFNEVKLLGSASSVSRTADQTLSARFWASSNSPNYLWNRVAASLTSERRTNLSENARLLAMMNVAIADAAIAVWNAKLSYLFWRPITAIQLADTDGNIATTADTNWTTLIPTPAYPDYPSGLVGTSAGGATVLARYFGADSSFIMNSNGMPGVTRFFPDFSAALDEVVGARIWSGIHFRFADVDSRQLGTAVANYITSNAFLPAIGLTFDAPDVGAGGSFSATFTGSNVTESTYFDVRFRGPDGVEQVALNWHRGTVGRHTVAIGTAVGDWLVTGIRAHQQLNEGTGGFAPVSVTLRVVGNAL